MRAEHAYRSAVPRLPLRNRPTMPVDFELDLDGALSWVSMPTIEVPDAVDRMLASLPERARRLRWTEAAAVLIGAEAFIAVRGELAPASDERRLRRRGRESSAVATEMDGRTWDSSAMLSPGVAGAVGVVSSRARFASAARGVVGVEGRGV